jgi:hypothetical protein
MLQEPEHTVPWQMLGAQGTAAGVEPQVPEALHCRGAV